MLYGMGQAGLQHVGLPTDYQIQQTQYKQALEQGEYQLKQQQLALQQQQVYVPGVGYMSMALAKTMGPAALRGQYQESTANITGQYGLAKEQQATRFQHVAGIGLFDTQPAGGGDAVLVPGTKGPTMDITPEVGQKFGIPQQLWGTTLPMQAFASIANAGIKTLPTATSHIEWKPDEYGVNQPYQVTGTSQKVGAPAGSAVPTTPQPSQVPASAVGVPSAAANRLPPGSLASQIITPRTPAEQRTSGGGGKWMVGTEPGTGRMVAVPASKAAQYPDAAQLPAADVTDMIRARQAYQNYTKIGDPKKPETMGVLQLIDSLDKDGQLGVFSSRLNSFMTKHVGASPGDDPRIITLLDKNHLGATKTMLAHIGKARSPEAVNMFLDMANAGTMNGPTLKAGTLAMADYMKDSGMYPSGDAAAQPPPPGPTSHIFDSAAWAKANPGKNVDAAKAYAKSQGYEVK
jgi:hypothetical protein